MSASPTSAVASAKRPLEDPSSPTGPNELPDAKRQALDKTLTDNNTTIEDGKVKPAANGSYLDNTQADATDSTATKDEAAVTDATNGTTVDDKQETMPIPSIAAPADHIAPQPPNTLPTQDESQWIHIRSVISSSEAATVIGKGGENVSQIRRMSGAKCTVSDYSRGAVERILTVSGAQDAVAKVGISSSQSAYN